MRQTVGPRSASGVVIALKRHLAGSRLPTRSRDKKTAVRSRGPLVRLAASLSHQTNAATEACATMKNRLGQIVPALLGRKCSMGAPGIGLWRHRPLATPRGVNLERGALFLAAVALSACAPHPRTALVYCLTPPQLENLKQAEPERIADKLTGQAQDDFKLVAGSDIMLRTWGEGLIGVLSGCTAP